MRTVPARETKNRFGSVVDEAQREPVTITRKGRPAVVILSHEEYELMGALECVWQGQLKISVRKRRKMASPTKY